MNITIYNATNKPTELEKTKIVNFLHKNLGQYGDPKEDILNCLSFALKERVSFGGFVIVAKEDDDEIVGAVIINKTGMNGYIPENILVYIATHEEHRGKGIGKKLMEKSISMASGDIALHVEANNPAKKLYEHFGFTNPYLEMRLKRS